jgi:hypothetical protein
VVKKQVWFSMRTVMDVSFFQRDLQC